jgi:6,7-dimethyl-8-ribityllumazine synthase
MDLNLAFNIPFIYGLLPTDNQAQARDRAGGKLGKGSGSCVYSHKNGGAS